jgi:hypothetical protein
MPANGKGRTTRVVPAFVVLHLPVTNQIDKGDGVGYNEFDLNIGEECYVFNLARSKEAF